VPGKGDNGNAEGDDQKELGGAKSGAVMIQIKGSDSEVNLVQKLAEEFMAENQQVQIAVTGGGSGVGIAAIIDGTIDIANSSRTMKNEEIEKARANGIDPVPVRFAVDGIAVIVNEKNPVGTLSVEEIGAIYRGEIKNWNEVGGENAKINLFGRQSNSGTYVFFMETVLKGDYSPEMRNMGGNADIVEAVKSDVTGIGYVAIGYTKEGDSVRPGIKVLDVSAEKGKPGVTPVELANITSGAYPITRPLYQFVAGQPQGAVRDFILFELSEKGEQIVLEQGFYPLSDADREFNKNSLKLN
jgi:phosphate transport system substrate-binding protein